MKNSIKYLIALVFSGLAVLTLYGVDQSQPLLDPGILNPQKSSNQPNLLVNTVKELVLCDNQTYQNYQKTPFVLEGQDAKNPSLKKIIRNCQFKNSPKAAIVIKSASNLLIENNIFDNIRSNQAGQDVHAISIACTSDKKCLIDKVTIKNNSFTSIGADGIQLGVNGNNIKNILIQENLFIGGEDVGENGIDVKGVIGLVHITKNTFQGFRPCESETQDCSGSNGAGLVIHEGSKSGRAQNLLVEKNELFNNVIGIVAANSDNHIIRNNLIHDNLEQGLEVRGVNTIEITENRFFNNPTSITVYQNVLNCFYGNNQIEQENFSDKSWGSCSQQ